MFFKISASSIKHLRLPFFIFLLPIFLFPLLFISNHQIWRLLLVFLIVNLLLYPASNSFNSYYDRDVGSIGMLKKPPMVNKELLYISLFLDLLALILAVPLGGLFFTAVFIYGMASKAYSHPKIRIKKYPFISLLWVGLGQGFCVFMMVYAGISGCAFYDLLNFRLIIPATLCFLYLTGAYPMTQIYQHTEDASRGDLSFSLRLGINGTFVFTLILYTVSAIAFIIYFIINQKVFFSWLYLASNLPALIYFLKWMIGYFSDRIKADYRHAMVLNWISSSCLNLFFIFMLLHDLNIKK